MAEENQEVDQGALDAVQIAADEREARRIGWKPKEQFKGNPSGWVDATEYIRRGKEYIPIIQHTNRELQGKVSTLEQALQEQQRLNRANAKALEALEASQATTTAATLEQTREQLDDQIVAAHQAGDLKLELRLRDDRAEVAEQIRTAKTTAKPKGAGNGAGGSDNGGGGGSERPPFDITKAPEFVAFEEANPWFKEDPVMRAASLEIGKQLASEHKLDGMTPTERFDAIAQATKERFNYGDNPRRSAQPRVDSGAGAGAGGDTGTNGRRGKGFNDLPTDAQSACDRMGKRMIGPGKKFKDEASYRAQYAKDYFDLP